MKTRLFGMWIAVIVALLSSCEVSTPPPKEKAELAPPPGMVLIPAGPFIMGSDKGQLNERRKRTITLPAFFIDRFEVTNADYSKFLTATGHLPPPGWPSPQPPRNKENCPVVDVTVHDALAYAKWAKKRLPTEEEWEKAARGPEGYDYPWGNEWKKGMGAESVESRRVTEFENARSPYGCIGMAGNVREWTSSKYTLNLKPDPGVPSFLQPFAYLFGGIELKTKYAQQTATLQSLSGVDRDVRVVKGGPSWLRDPSDCRAPFRESMPAETRDPSLGFRCAK
jgi:formylglycine-generating enzyme required for sulfatase activity